jgi:hypothetical protein
MVIQADDRLSIATRSNATAVTSAQAGAVVGKSLGTIDQPVQISVGNPVRGSAAKGSSGLAPAAGGDK